MPAAPKPFYRMLYVQVLIGLALGVTVGHFWPEFGAALNPFGDGFLKLVKMMIAPICSAPARIDGTPWGHPSARRACRH
jgi:Zn-dependent protease